MFRVFFIAINYSWYSNLCQLEICFWHLMLFLRFWCWRHFRKNKYSRGRDPYFLFYQLFERRPLRDIVGKSLNNSKVNRIIKVQITRPIMEKNSSILSDTSLIILVLTFAVIGILLSLAITLLLVACYNCIFRDDEYLGEFDTIPEISRLPISTDYTDYPLVHLKKNATSVKWIKKKGSVNTKTISDHQDKNMDNWYLIAMITFTSSLIIL